MNGIRRREMEEPAFQIAPMIDMTFLLLIFFMVTSRISQEQKKMNLNLPMASHATLQEKPAGRVLVNILADGRTFVGEQEVPLGELGVKVKSVADPRFPLRLWIRAESSVGVRRIREVMRSCAEVGAVEIQLGTCREKK